MKKSKIGIKKIPIEIMIFTLILICIEKVMYLVDDKIFKIAGILNLDDFSLLLSIALFVVVFLKYIKFPKSKYEQKFIIFFPIILAIVSSYMGKKVYGQPFMFGFRPQRFFILTSLLYFPLKRMIECDSQNITRIKNLLISLGTIELILYIFQYLLINKVVFLSMRVSSRFGEVRLPFESLLLLLYPFIVLNELLNKRNVKRNSILLALSFIYIVVVLKTRMVMFGMVGVITFLILIYRSGASKKIYIIFLLLIVGIIGVNTSIGQSYIQSISSENRSIDPNTLIRKEAQEFYITETAKSPITGRGYVNILYNDAVIISKYNKGYYFNDNGIIGFYYLYGLIGIGWLLIMFFKLSKLSWRAYKNKSEYWYLGYSIYLVVTSFTLLNCYIQSGAFYIIIILAFLEIDNNYISIANA
ncbi:O-antigen ligase family protein [Clostridium sp.]|uniref:O-antigen ligase family protein n=1 Tax=Clostridium sp. TaxID=1506 RepID=UPI003990DB96